MLRRKLSMFAIQLENQQAVYHSGQHVKGQVLVELNDPMKMRGIQIHFVGEAKVYWKKRTTEGGRTRKKYMCYYQARQTYFNNTLVLFGKPYGDRSGENPVLEKGTYTYPFEFVLAANLPSSFEGEIGRVRYYIQATIDKPWKFDHRTMRPFTVLSILDLSKMPEAALCHGAEAKKYFTSVFSWPVGDIRAQLVLAQKGFVPGEQIAAMVEIQNDSKKDVDEFTLTLRQTRLFYGFNHGERFTKTVDLDVVEVKGPGGVKKGETTKFRDVMLAIPPLPPSSLVGCSCIDIIYKLVLSLAPSGNSKHLFVPLEILIGTIPIRRQYAAPSMMPTAPPIERETPSAPQAPPAPDAPPAYYDGPPPSYAECMTGKIDIYQGDEADEEDSGSRAASGHVHGDTMWTPSYTFYNFSDYGIQHGVDMVNHV